MANKTSILDRIKQHYNLKGNAELAVLLGVTPQTISNWYGRDTLDYDKIFTNCVNVDFNWLLTGRGEILKSSERSVLAENPKIEGNLEIADPTIFNTKTPKNTINSNDGKIDGVIDGFPKLRKTPSIAEYPPLDDDASQGLMADRVLQQRFTLSADRPAEVQMIPIYESLTLHSLDSLFSNGIKPSSYISLPNLPKCDGAVRMWGDKMSPELKSGDLLVFKKVKDLRSGIFLGHIYLMSIELEGEEYVMVQYLEASECEKSVKMVSKNDRYPPKDIPIDSIKALAMIKACIRYQSV